MAEKIDSKGLIPEAHLQVIEHNQRIEWLKHRTAIGIVIAGFVVVCFVILLPLDWFSTYHEGAWTFFTALISSAAGYLYGTKDTS